MISLVLAINILAAGLSWHQPLIIPGCADLGCTSSLTGDSAPALGMSLSSTPSVDDFSDGDISPFGGASLLNSAWSDDGKRIRHLCRLVDSGNPGWIQKEQSEEDAPHGESYQALFREAKYLFREQKYRESLKLLERCLSLNQRDPELYKLVASDSILLDRMDIAEQALKTAAELAPHDYLVFFHLGALYYTDSRFPAAQPMLEKSVNLNPEYVPARLFLGLTLEELGQEQAAIDCYHRAIEIGEMQGLKEEQPYLYLGRLLYRQTKMDESLPYLRKAVQLNPRSCESLCLVARIVSLRGNETEAMKALDQCIEADPKNPEAHYLLSRSHAKQGRMEDAAKELSIFQELKKLEKDTKDPRKNQRARPHRAPE